MKELESPDSPEEANMSVLDHLRELRTRLFYVIGAVLIVSAASFYYSTLAFEVLKKPYIDAFGSELLIGTGPAEAFILKLKAALLLGVLLSCPIIFYQIWQFVVPALYQHERKLVLPFVFFSTLLFVVGIWFCYTLVMPFGLEFFHDQYQSINVTPTIKISEYLGLLIKALLGFGIVFELPVLCFFLGKLGIITDEFLWKYARHSIAIIFFVAAFLTPPDVLTQIMMAGPLILLYFLSILIVKWVQPTTPSDENDV